jgi:hypothetical protein
MSLIAKVDVHALCDVDEDEYVDADELVYHLALVAMGGLLIVSSPIGNALCIWNLKRGQLMKRHNDTIDQRMTDEVGFTDMVYLQRLNACVTMYWSTVVWKFPTDKITNEMILSIQQRERNIKRMQLGLVEEH